MSEFAAGEIYYTDVPFDDATGSKIRPILVMSDETVCVLSYKMTSHMPRDEYDYLLKEWNKSARNGERSRSALFFAHKFRFCFGQPSIILTEESR